MLLSICIPTFNREKHLDNCLNSILISAQEIKNFKFEVCVSDNNSNFNVFKIINKYKKKININFKQNKNNLGFALNAIQVVSMAKGKFAWLIGNDDLLLPHTLLEIKKLLNENRNINVFFLNSYFLNSSEIRKMSSPINTKKINLTNLNSISNLKKNRKCFFWDLIDPNVSWDFLIGMFLTIFRRKDWLKHLNVLDHKKIKDLRPWSNFDNTCLHPKVLSASFKNSNAFICSQPLSINLIGEREWYNLYDFIEIVRIPELLDYYRSLGLPFKKYLICKNYSLRNFSNYFLKIIIGGKKSGLNYINFKRNFFKNLIYPNVYLSLFYFIFRKIKKYLIKEK